ncbi:MAG: hypothetical protein WCD42_03260, partial [Rhizomicrobium sp.]
MLDPSLKEQLKGYLERITLPIELAASLDDSDASQELFAFLEEIAPLSDKITLARRDDDARRPSFAITRTGSQISVRFAGIPSGHEFNSLVLALLYVGGHPSKLTPDVIDQIKALDGDYSFETYF